MNDTTAALCDELTNPRWAIMAFVGVSNIGWIMIPLEQMTGHSPSAADGIDSSRLGS